MLWFLSVIDSTKSWDKEKWIEAFEKSRYMSTKGLRVMRASDHQAMQDAFIGEFFSGEGKNNPFGLPYPKCGYKVLHTYQAKELY
jgi:branched-chain amino acid transport system substrate-binding protein